MRGANAYQALNQTHERLDEGKTDLPGLRYEALRDTVQEVDRNPTPALLRVIDSLETRRAGLEQELTELREAGRGPGPGAPERNQQTDIDRALALQPDDVAPKQWTEKGGMVEQQASALDWLKQSDEVRRERAEPAPGLTRGRETPDPAAHDLSSEDRELLAAARISDAHGQQQEHGPSRGHEPLSP